MIDQDEITQKLGPDELPETTEGQAIIRKALSDAEHHEHLAVLAEAANAPNAAARVHWRIAEAHREIARLVGRAIAYGAFK